MSKSKVISFSLPPQTANQLEELAKRLYMNRSEFLRELLNNYSGANQGVVVGAQPATSALDKADIASLLKTYWQQRQSSTSHIVTIGLGIMSDINGRILIARRPREPVVSRLTWGFPGGELRSLDFAQDLEETILSRTGVKAQVGNLVSARAYPDTTDPRIQIVALYFACEAGFEDENAQYDNRYIETKLVEPMEVFKYFTTSVSDEVTRYLASLSGDAPDD